MFVDFNPSGNSAGRPAVTYREVRASHQVRWTVLLDGTVRISLGCQSRPGGEDAVRDACEQAVRSAHANRMKPESLNRTSRRGRTRYGCTEHTEHRL